MASRTCLLFLIAAGMLFTDAPRANAQFNPYGSPNVQLKSKPGFGTLQPGTQPGIRTQTAPAQAAPQNPPPQPQIQFEDILRMIPGMMQGPAYDNQPWNDDRENSNSYGRRYPSQPRYDSTPAPPRVALPTLTASDYRRMSYGELSNLLREAARQLSQSLSRLSTGQSWKKYLETEQLGRAMSTEQLASPDQDTRDILAAIRRRYEETRDEPGYRSVWDNDAYEKVMMTLRQYDRDPVERGREQLATRTEELADALDRFPTGASWKRYLKLDDLSRAMAESPVRESSTPSNQEILRAIKERFDAVQNTPDYRMVAQLAEFQKGRDAMTEWMKAAKQAASRDPARDPNAVLKLSPQHEERELTLIQSGEPENTKESEVTLKQFDVPEEKKSPAVTLMPLGVPDKKQSEATLLPLGVSAKGEQPEATLLQFGDSKQDTTSQGSPPKRPKNESLSETALGAVKLDPQPEQPGKEAQALAATSKTVISPNPDSQANEAKSLPIATDSPEGKVVLERFNYWLKNSGAKVQLNPELMRGPADLAAEVKPTADAEVAPGTIVPIVKSLGFAGHVTNVGGEASKAGRIATLIVYAQGQPVGVKSGIVPELAPQGTFQVTYLVPADVVYEIDFVTFKIEPGDGKPANDSAQLGQSGKAAPMP